MRKLFGWLLIVVGILWIVDHLVGMLDKWTFFAENPAALVLKVIADLALEHPKLLVPAP